jgi:hypothetical protein
MVINMTAVLICAIICFTMVALFYIAASTAAKVGQKENEEDDKEDKCSRD